MKKVTDVFEVVETSVIDPKRNKAIAEWLDANTDSHTIQDHNKMVALFEKDLAEFNVKAPWLKHSYAQTLRAIENRGLGGTLAKSDVPLCYGYEMAEACAWEFAKFNATKLGRGSRFRECEAALLNIA